MYGNTDVFLFQMLPMHLLTLLIQRKSRPCPSPSPSLLILPIRYGDWYWRRTLLLLISKLVLARLPQDNTLHELTKAFLVKETTVVEVVKHNSHVYGAFI